MTTPVATLLTPQPVFVGQKPKEGARAIRLTLTFDAGETYSVPLDIQNFSCLQSVFIDNTASPNRTTVQCADGDKIVCEAFSRGVFPVVTGVMFVQISNPSTNGCQVTIVLCNVFIPPLDNDTIMTTLGTGDAIAPVRTGNIYGLGATTSYLKYPADAAITLTNPFAIWAPGTTPGTPLFQGVANGGSSLFYYITNLSFQYFAGHNAAGGSFYTIATLVDFDFATGTIKNSFASFNLWISSAADWVQPVESFQNIAFVGQWTLGVALALVNTNPDPQAEALMVNIVGGFTNNTAILPSN